MNILAKTSNFMKNNLPLVILFIIATTFFIYQRATITSWDFSSYILNAKYLFFQGEYFETIRPPLPSILLGVFLLIGVLGEYIYIIFVSSLFLYSSIKLSSFLTKNKAELNFNNFLFYTLALGVSFLWNGMREGSELLALSFLYLTIYFLLSKKNMGIPLALSFLSRYNMLLFFPLILINKSIKSIIKNIITFILIISPWLIYNYVKFGNAFTSIIDAYANNVLLRSYLFSPFQIQDLLLAIGTFSPLIILGLVISIINFIKTKEHKIKNNLITILFLILGIIILLDFSSIPLKEFRYLFNLILPATYFAWIGTKYLIKRMNLNENAIKIIIILFILIISLSLVAYNSHTITESPVYKEASNKIIELNLKDCKIYSPHWVPLAYYLGNVHPLTTLQEVISENAITIIFPESSTLDDSFSQEELDSSNKIYSTRDFMIIGNADINSENCVKKEVYVKPYVQNPCEIITLKFNSQILKKIANKTCYLFDR